MTGLCKYLQENRFYDKDVRGPNKFEFKKLNHSEGVNQAQLYVNSEFGNEQNMAVK